MKNTIKRKIKRIIKSPRIRFTVYLPFSILAGVLMALFKITAGMITSSAWLIFAGVYYSVLCITRFYILKENKKTVALDTRRKFIREFKAYRNTGFTLMLITLPYLLMCVRMFRFRDFETHMTFIAVSFAIIAGIKLISGVIGIYNTKDIHSPL